MKTIIKLIKQYHLLIVVVLAVFICYVILINNPIISYNCNKNIAHEIISQDKILSYSNQLYRNNIIFKPIVIIVSEADMKNGTIKVEYVPIIPTFTKIMEFSKYDVPYVYGKYGLK
jgi:hypothetical protein